MLRIAGILFAAAVLSILSACEGTAPASDVTSPPATLASATPTLAPTAAPVPTVTPTVAATATPMVIPTATSTPVPTATPTATAVPTVAPTATPTPVPALLEFKGELPPIGPVTYVVPEGETVTVPGFQGWVSLVVVEGITPDQVARTAGLAGGKIIEANARLGLYTLAVSPGGEAALIARLSQESWVAAASPTFLLEPTQGPDKPVKLVDIPYKLNDPSNTGIACHDRHGDLTALQVASRGHQAQVIDARDKDLLQTGELIEEAMKTGSAVNVSMGAQPEWRGMAVKGAGYRHLQGTWLAMVFSIAEKGPDVPVIVSAGNGDAERKGQPLTRYLEALKKQFPKAGKRVRIVEATRQQDEKRRSSSDYSESKDPDIRSISAPGEDVPIDTTGLLGSPIKCSGTSYAAPIVTALIAEMRKAAPGKSSEEIWKSFDKVTQGKVPWDWDKTLLPSRLVREVTGHGIATLVLNPPSITIQVGKNQLLQAVMKEASGALIQDVPASALTWTSSNPVVATVDRSGFVDGRSPGTVVITASIDGIQATAGVLVTPPPTPTPTPTPTPEPVSFAITSVTCQLTGTRTSGSETYATWDLTVSGTASGPVNYSVKVNNNWVSGVIKILQASATASSWTVNPESATAAAVFATRQAGQPASITWTLHAVFEISRTNFNFFLKDGWATKKINGVVYTAVDSKPLNCPPFP